MNIYTIGVAFIIIIAVLVGILIGYGTQCKEYKPSVIRKISLIKTGENTWELKYPFKVEADTNYYFILDFPEGQDK